MRPVSLFEYHENGLLLMKKNGDISMSKKDKSDSDRFLRRK